MCVFARAHTCVCARVHIYVYASMLQSPSLSLSVSRFVWVAVSSLTSQTALAPVKKNRCTSKLWFDFARIQLLPK